MQKLSSFEISEEASKSQNQKMDVTSLFGKPFRFVANQCKGYATPYGLVVDMPVHIIVSVSISNGFAEFRLSGDLNDIMKPYFRLPIGTEVSAILKDTLMYGRMLDEREYNAPGCPKFCQIFNDHITMTTIAGAVVVIELYGCFQN